MGQFWSDHNKTNFNRSNMVVAYQNDRSQAKIGPVVAKIQFGYPKCPNLGT